MPALNITVTEGPICPKCGGAEVLLGGPVRPYKVGIGAGPESHCTDCDVWFRDEHTELITDIRETIDAGTSLNIKDIDEGSRSTFYGLRLLGLVTTDEEGGIILCQ